MPFYPADWVATMQPALWTWVNGVLNPSGSTWTVIWADAQGPGQTEQGPAPVHPFASLFVVMLPAEEVRTSVSGIEVDATTMTTRVRTGGRFVFEVQLFTRDRGQSVTAEASLRHSVASSYPHVEALFLAGLTPAEPVLTRDITDVRGARREFRHVLEFPMRVEMRTDTINQPWIETVSPPSLTLT